jgi:hypothetical protein
MGIPLQEGEGIAIATEAEHALFLQCCEVYRVIDLLQRNLGSMVDTYSKFRTRDPFREALILRFFGVDETILCRVDPLIEAMVLAAFNRLHELKLSLVHADALPFTVRSGIERELSHLRKGWDMIREAVEARLGWKLKPLDESLL